MKRYEWIEYEGEDGSGQKLRTLMLIDHKYPKTIAVKEEQYTTFHSNCPCVFVPLNSVSEARRKEPMPEYILEKKLMTWEDGEVSLVEEVKEANTGKVIAEKESDVLIYKKTKKWTYYIKVQSLVPEDDGDDEDEEESMEA